MELVQVLVLVLVLVLMLVDGWVERRQDRCEWL
jgi:hypothetical protein